MLILLLIIVTILNTKKIPVFYKKMVEFDYQWKHTLKKEDLENEEDKFECNEKRVKDCLLYTSDAADE